MTAWGSVELAVEAMRRGARDFIQKPWDNARLLAIVRTQIELSQALRKGQRLEAENSLLRGEGMPQIVAESPAMQPVLQVVARVGPSDANVLILGENGTGKGVVARALHAVSSRASRPMVIVNSGGVSEGVFESELFGHVRGAFTDAKADRVGRFELADQGTLFLDEIANVPLSQQAKLLRVIETGEFERLGSSRTRRVNVRIISATNANLNDEVRPAASGRTCCSGSTPSRSGCRRCAIAAKTCRCSPSTSCASTRSATASGSPASRAAPCSNCWSTPGPATSASWITRSSAPS
jgi:DNA-binding NtrC family response regulator